jgi:hypothetical protein
MRIHEAVGMAAEAMHVAEASRNPALAHDDRDLMQGFGQQGPVVPIVVGAAHAGSRVALDRMVEVGEFQGIADEEDRRVVADEIPIAFLGVELHRKAANVTLGIGRAAFARHRREAGEHLGLLSDF